MKLFAWMLRNSPSMTMSKFLILLFCIIVLDPAMPTKELAQAIDVKFKFMIQHNLNNPNF